MKVVIACPLWGYFGGREQYLADTVEELTGRGYECYVLHDAPTGKPITSGAAARVETFRFPGLDRFETDQDARNAATLESVLGIIRPDVVFPNDVKNIALLRVLSSRGRMVSMAHYPWLFCLRDNRTRFLSRKACSCRLGAGCLLRGCFLGKPLPGSGAPLRYNSLGTLRRLLEVYRGVDTHVVASRYMAEIFREHGFRAEQVHTIGLYTDLPPRKEIRYPEGDPNILYIGRVDRYKGVDLLIRALRLCTTNFALHVAGDGPFLPHCRKLARSAGVESRVIFHGWMPREETRSLLRGTRAVIMPSVCPEAFGMAGIEALAHSRPVAGFDSGGISDWLRDGETGCLVPAGDVRGLARSIDLLIRMPGFAQDLGIAGRALVEERFTRNAHFDALTRLFRGPAAPAVGCAGSESRWTPLSSETPAGGYRITSPLRVLSRDG